jgi:L-alanine-DL-glutamate epimerase-like enolase superfamily enzyme
MNQAYDPKVAIQVIRKMEESSIQIVEQPVHRRDLYGMNMVRRNVQVPIGACESAISMHDFIQVVKSEAADFLNFKIARSGGFYRGKAIVQVAAAAGMFVVGSTQLGSGIELAANAHFATATIQVGPPPYHCSGYGTGLLKLFDATDSKGITGDIVHGTPKVENGFVYVPQVPGLGVDLDDDIALTHLTPGKKVLAVGEVPVSVALGRG